MGRILSIFNQEVQLVKALKKEDAKAQRLLYDKYSSRMLVVCQRYVNDSMAAEDVMVEGFLKVFGKIDQFNGEGSFEGLIRRIMVNKALGYRRKYKKIMDDVSTEDIVNMPDMNYADDYLQAE